MSRFAFQTRIVRTPANSAPAPVDPVTGRSTLDPVMLHTIARAQVQHAAIATVSVMAAWKVLDAANKIAVHIATTRI